MRVRSENLQEPVGVAPVAWPAVPTFQTSPGMRDILPPEAGRFEQLVAVFAEIVESAGYGRLNTPLIEDYGVFVRIGDATDVVSKEMYDFTDHGDRHVALRPEVTASACRAFAQHRPTPPWKVFYSGPNFRHEKAQRGRYRQFEQVGVEVLGVDDPLLDVEVIALAWEFYAALGLRQVDLIVNSLGEPADRARYVAALKEYFTAAGDALSAASRATLVTNPLRVLDSKRPEDQSLIAAAPSIADFYDEGASAHFAAVCAGLDAIGVPYRVEPKLVRGLDYYRRTIFEFQGGTFDSAQNALGGGGRYDGLVEDLGGPATPGVGFALGVDRTVLACDDEGVFAATPRQLDAFVVDVVDGTHALALTTELRRAGLAVDRAFDGRSMKAQMKLANRSNARHAVIVGPDEVATDTVQLKPLFGGDQRTVPRGEIAAQLRKSTSS